MLRKKNPTALPRWTPYQLAIVNGLQSKPVYQGPADWSIEAPRKARRRAANKVAAASRRQNRGR